MAELAESPLRSSSLFSTDATKNEEIGKKNRGMIEKIGGFLGKRINLVKNNSINELSKNKLPIHEENVQQEQVALENTYQVTVRPPAPKELPKQQRLKKEQEGFKERILSRERARATEPSGLLQENSSPRNATADLRTQRKNAAEELKKKLKLEEKKRIEEEAKRKIVKKEGKPAGSLDRQSLASEKQASYSSSGKVLASALQRNNQALTSSLSHSPMPLVSKTLEVNKTNLLVPSKPLQTNPPGREVKPAKLPSSVPSFPPSPSSSDTSSKKIRKDSSAPLLNSGKDKVSALKYNFEY